MTTFKVYCKGPRSRTEHCATEARDGPTDEDTCCPVAAPPCHPPRGQPAADHRETPGLGTSHPQLPPREGPRTWPPNITVEWPILDAEILGVGEYREPGKKIQEKQASSREIELLFAIFPAGNLNLFLFVVPHVFSFAFFFPLLFVVRSVPLLLISTVCVCACVDFSSPPQCGHVGPQRQKADFLAKHGILLEVLERRVIVEDTILFTPGTLLTGSAESFVTYHFQAAISIEVTDICIPRKYTNDKAMSYLIKSVIMHEETIQYNTSWYETSVVTKKLLQMVILRSNKGSTFRFYNMFDASLRGFSVLFQTSLSYFMVLVSLQ
ncbi:uncharacterized protein LOC143264095 [Megachile rotundata]|uniref:uncharacterized protein LOC143264095 n=1 Tax=Megachile rotundata TaxID=143995 RepID=UPI003FD2B4EE